MIFSSNYLQLWVYVTHVMQVASRWKTIEGQDLRNLPEEMFCKPPYRKPGYRSLRIRETNIKDIHQNAFKCLDNLQYLGVHDSNITYLPGGIFKENHKLKGIDLRGK